MPETPRLLLLRHGESTWNARGLWQGQADPPLSKKGEEQARTAAERLEGAGLTAVVSSDLRRAVRTGELIAKRLGLPAVALDEGFREVDVGHWSGLTRLEIEKKWPGQRTAWAENRLKSTPGGELLADFTDRVVGAMVRIAASATGPVLIIGHSRVLSALERYVGLKPDRPTHLAGRWFTVNGEGRLQGLEPVHLLGTPPGPPPEVSA